MKHFTDAAINHFIGCYNQEYTNKKDSVFLIHNEQDVLTHSGRTIILSDEKLIRSVADNQSSFGANHIITRTCPLTNSAYRTHQLLTLYFLRCVKIESIPDSRINYKEKPAFYLHRSENQNQDLATGILILKKITNNLGINLLEYREDPQPKITVNDIIITDSQSILEINSLKEKYLSVKILCLRIPTDKFEFFDTTNTGSLSLFFSGFKLRSSVNKVERQIKSLAATRNSKKSERSLNEDIYDFISNKSLRPRDTALEQILLLPELCAILLDFDNKELHKHKLGLAFACVFFCHHDPLTKFRAQSFEKYRETISLIEIFLKKFIDSSKNPPLIMIYLYNLCIIFNASSNPDEFVQLPKKNRLIHFLSNVSIGTSLMAKNQDSEKYFSAAEDLLSTIDEKDAKLLKSLSGIAKRPDENRHQSQEIINSLPSHFRWPVFIFLKSRCVNASQRELVDELQIGLDSLFSKSYLEI
ncbi:MAG: hypothetical protein HRU10_11135 [Opitutales bacterium]|nr:hypothetical protein [Opitutales bacterium]